MTAQLLSAVLLPGVEGMELEPALAHYREHGYVRLGRVIDAAFLDRLRARSDELMLGRVVHDGLFFQHDSDSGRYEDLSYGKGYVGPSLDYRKIEKLERDDRFRALIENPLFERIVRAVVADEAVIYRACMFAKGRSGGSPIPWHQDGGSYWGLDRTPELQIWTALDDAGPRAGCVEVFAGSHKAGLATPLGGVVPANHVQARGADTQATPVPVEAGEVLLIHNLMWHRSARNDSGVPRRAFTVCYMSAATRCLRKKHAPREFVGVFRGGRGNSTSQGA